MFFFSIKQVTITVLFSTAKLLDKGILTRFGFTHVEKVIYKASVYIATIYYRIGVNKFVWLCMQRHILRNLSRIYDAGQERFLGFAVDFREDQVEYGRKNKRKGYRADSGLTPR